MSRAIWEENLSPRFTDTSDLCFQEDTDSPARFIAITRCISRLFNCFLCRRLQPRSAGEGGSVRTLPFSFLPLTSALAKDAAVRCAPARPTAAKDATCVRSVSATQGLGSGGSLSAQCSMHPGLRQVFGIALGSIEASNAGNSASPITATAMPLTFPVSFGFPSRRKLGAGSPEPNWRVLRLLPVLGEHGGSWPESLALPLTIRPIGPIWGQEGLCTPRARLARPVGFVLLCSTERGSSS